MKNHLAAQVMSWIVMFSISCSGCAAPRNAASADTHADLFLDPAKRVGEHVVLRGYLHWRFEDRSLYPSERDVSDDRLCLPVLIKSKRKDLIEYAKSRDGATVEISGMLVHAARPGMVSVSTCKPVGIDVDTIR
jgi:hypothetical protein